MELISGRLTMAGSLVSPWAGTWGKLALAGLVMGWPKGEEVFSGLVFDVLSCWAEIPRALPTMHLPDRALGRGQVCWIFGGPMVEGPAPFTLAIMLAK